MVFTNFNRPSRARASDVRVEVVFDYFSGRSTTFSGACFFRCAQGDDLNDSLQVLVRRVLKEAGGKIEGAP